LLVPEKLCVNRNAYRNGYRQHGRRDKPTHTPHFANHAARQPVREIWWQLIPAAMGSL
jgi:hypothetical protein